MPRVPIDSMDDRRLEPFRNLKFTSEMRRHRLFVAEGDKLVRRLLHSRFQVHSVLAGEQFLANGQFEIPPQVTTFVAPDSLLREIVGFKFHRGVLACGVRCTGQSLIEVMERRPWPAAGTPLTADVGWVPHSADPTGPRASDQPLAVVVCVDIQDPTNLGTILRTAEAFGVAVVVLAGDCADPFSRRVLRVSMGAPFQLPLVHSTNLAADLATLRERWQVTVLAAVANVAAEPLERIARPNRFAIVLGNESRGLSAACVTACDRRVTIPMTPGADSLNVSVAHGILLYHFLSARPQA
jgi:tRNA G18 (ribose-2'-O)-methylase SpoU